MLFGSAPLKIEKRRWGVGPRSANWNTQDPLDLEVKRRLTSQAWLPKRPSLGEDLPTWRLLTPEEREGASKVLMNLASFESLQGLIMAPNLEEDAATRGEREVFTDIALMRETHRQAYVFIHETFWSEEEADGYRTWLSEDKYLTRRDSIVIDHSILDDAPLVKKAATVIFGSLLSHSGFYLPFLWGSQGKLTAVADLTRLMFRDEATYCFYLGQRFQQGFKELSPEGKNRVKERCYDFLLSLQANELALIEEVFAPLGLTEEVQQALHYSANKALVYLGFTPHIPLETISFSPVVGASFALDC